MASLQLPYGVSPLNPIAIDERFGKKISVNGVDKTVPFADLTEAQAYVPLESRYPGLTIIVRTAEYATTGEILEHSWNEITEVFEPKGAVSSFADLEGAPGDNLVLNEEFAKKANLEGNNTFNGVQRIKGSKYLELESPDEKTGIRMFGQDGKYVGDFQFNYNPGSEYFLLSVPLNFPPNNVIASKRALQIDFETLHGKFFGTVEAQNAVNAKDLVTKEQLDQQATDLTGGALPAELNTLYKIATSVQGLNALITDNTADADTIVNKFGEVIQLLANFSEGADIAALINARVAITDIYNALDYAIAGKVLDARQGKVLKEAIDGLNNNVVKLTGDQEIAGNKTFTGTTTLGNVVLSGVALTPTAAELNRVSGVTSPIQAQINNKANNEYAPSTQPAWLSTILTAGKTTLPAALDAVVAQVENTRITLGVLGNDQKTLKLYKAANFQAM